MSEDVIDGDGSRLKSRRSGAVNQPVYGAVSGSAGLAIGYASAAAGEKSNEDCFGVMTAHEMPEAAERGIALAVADGGSAGGTGRIAAELTVRTLLHDFYATPASWSVKRSIDCVLRSVNDWLYVENGRNPDLGGVVTTLSMLLIRAGGFHLAHIGDSRVYRCRNQMLERLTVDHTWPRRDMRHILRRAVGLDSHLVIDISAGETLPGDVMLVASDGVWEVVGDDVVERLLASELGPEKIACELVDTSLRNQLQYMGRNDATAIVVRIMTSV